MKWEHSHARFKHLDTHTVSMRVWLSVGIQGVVLSKDQGLNQRGRQTDRERLYAEAV